MVKKETRIERREILEESSEKIRENSNFSP